MVVLSSSMSSWFRRESVPAPTMPDKISMKEAVQSLTPKKLLDPDDRNRFSQLLLEHGEHHLQDWAVVASSKSFPSSSSAASRSRNGMLTHGAATTTQWAQQSRKRPHHPKRPSVQIYEKAFAPSVNMGKIEGRLHLCSRSIVFEPLDCTRGIVRCPFFRMEAPPREIDSGVTGDADVSPSKPNLLHDNGPSNRSNSDTETLVIEFHCSRHLVMKANNVVGPFDSIEVPVQFRFTFLHSSPDRFAELCTELYRLVNGTGRKGFATPELDAIMKPMLDRPFDPSNLVDVRERPLTSNLRCTLVTPLQSKPGCAIVTSERIYFQSAVGVLNEGSVTTALSWLQCDMVAKARRYSGLRDSALELYFKDGSSVLLAFERPREREKVMRLLPKHVPCHTDRDFVIEAQREWQKGMISNYDYLLVLNSAAGRTFHDLSRYPIFPWVIADYESDKLDLTNESTFRDLTRPMGALNEERLDYFRTRLNGMHDMEDPFLYGTHYSAPGYVLYYLVRSMPEHMLCLQNGKFDAADRMFYSIPHCYSCALTNHADVKELIPEFYNPASGFDFLINARSLQLGATQTGDRVDDVTLPPWARSPRDFLKKNRKALESDICTRMLPRWIDLIFGVNSRGEAAREASNLFHPMAYLGPKDLQKMNSDEERFQAELQAVEFGIVPDSLFGQPHPLREDPADPDECVLSDFGRAVLNEGEGSVGGDGESRSGEQAWELLETPSSHTHEDEIMTERGRLDSSESTPSNKGEAPTVGFGSAASVNSSKVISMAQKQVLSPKTPTTPVIRERPVTPGGKAKSSWSTNLSVPSIDESEQRQEEVEVAGPIDGGKPSFDEYNYLGTVQEDQRPNRKLPLSGSGDMAPHGGKRPKAGVAQAKQMNQPQSRQRARETTSRPANEAPVSTSVITIAEWDLKMLEKKALHSDSISGCALLIAKGPQKLSFLTTVSLDGTLKVQTISIEHPQKKDRHDASRRSFTGTLAKFPYIGMSQTASTQSKLGPYRNHTSADPLACLAQTGDGNGGQVVFAGGHDDVVLAYGINSACAVASVYSHRDAVTGLDIIERPVPTTENVLWSEKSTHIMVSGSWDATVKVWSVTVDSGETVSINREPLAELFDADSSVVCLSATTVNGGVAISAGCADGSFVVWLCHDDGTKVMIHKEAPRRGSGPCSAVKWIRERGQLNLLTAFSTGKIASFALSHGTIRKISAVSVGVSVKCMEYTHGILLVGCADGGLRLIPMNDRASFEERPTLFPSLHGKSASGITCISMALASNQCMCCTGAEDGSVAFFELKRDIL